MGESQSRYSIVERLTKQKLDIMTAKSNLNDEILLNIQKKDLKEKNIKQSKKRIDQEAEKGKIDLDFELKEIENKIKNLKEIKKSKEELFDNKIKAINEALDKLEEISKISQS